VTPADQQAIDEIKRQCQRIGEYMSQLSDEQFAKVSGPLKESQDVLNAIIREAEEK
jgi:hypothetical protein